VSLSDEEVHVPVRTIMHNRARAHTHIPAPTPTPKHSVPDGEVLVPVRMTMNVCLDVYMYVCMYVYIHSILDVYMYVCMYVYTRSRCVTRSARFSANNILCMRTRRKSTCAGANDDTHEPM
jgi:hypothetical protein